MVVWLRHIHRASDPGLEDVEAVSEDMPKIYRNKGRKLNMVMKLMADFLEVANEPVRVYDNQIKANWRTAVWLQQDDKNHYQIVWSRLWPGLLSKIKLLTLKNGWINSMEQILDCATDLEVKPDCQ